MSVHIEIDELADAAAGALEDDRTEAVVRHVDGCANCRQSWSALAEVSRQLSIEPPPPMPPEVARRLTEVVSTESRQRSESGASVPLPSRHNPSLGSFQAQLPTRSRMRTAGSVLAACSAAGVVGFAGYLLSASAGLNEPPALAPAVVSSSNLGRQAQALQRATNLEPHRFSKAWRCARQVAPGRITGLTSAQVDGRPALLVYSVRDNSESAGATLVTVVTGCPAGAPSAGPSTTVPR